jgi:hypothetical protein
MEEMPGRVSESLTRNKAIDSSKGGIIQMTTCLTNTAYAGHGGSGPLRHVVDQLSIPDSEIRIRSWIAK